MKKSELIKTAEKINTKVYKSWTNEKIEIAIKKRLGFLEGNVSDIIDHHTKWSKSYCWSPNTHASDRRSEEKSNTFDVEYTFDGDTYYYKSEVSMSCKNIYYTGNFKINGVSKNLRLFKKLLLNVEQIKVQVQK